MNAKRSKRDFCIAYSDEYQPDEVESLSKEELVFVLSSIVDAARNVGWLGPIVAESDAPNCLAGFIAAELETRYPADTGRNGAMFDADEIVQGWASEDVSSVFSGSGKLPDDNYTEHVSSRRDAK